MLVVHHFQDAHTFDLKKTRTCCVHYALPSGEMVPFCVYNNLWRGHPHAESPANFISINNL